MRPLEKENSNAHLQENENAKLKKIIAYLEDNGKEQTEDHCLPLGEIVERNTKKTAYERVVQSCFLGVEVVLLGPFESC